MLGAFPRGPGMERKDLLAKNCAIFKEQGRLLDELASKNVKVVVVGFSCFSSSPDRDLTLQLTGGQSGEH